MRAIFRLLKQVIELAKEKKIERISVTIRPGNERSIKLFSANGFEKIKLMKDYFKIGIKPILKDVTVFLGHSDFGKGKDRFLYEIKPV